MKTFANFCEEGGNNKLILLVGPNGSCKTSLVRKIMLAAEEYSQTQGGPAPHLSIGYFPQMAISRRLWGYRTFIIPNQLESFAHLDDSEIAAIINSDLKGSPPPAHSSRGPTKTATRMVCRPVLITTVVSKSRTWLPWETGHQKPNDLRLPCLKVIREITSRSLNIFEWKGLPSVAASPSAAVSVEPQMHVDATNAANYHGQKIGLSSPRATIP